MSADVMHSLGMIPHISTLDGFQAVCFGTDGEVHWQGDDRIPYIEGGMMTWLGDWHATYIDAKLDAAAHNALHHPAPAKSWDEIIRGHGE